MCSIDYIKMSSEYAKKILKEEIPPHLKFHNYKYTCDVVKLVNLISHAERLSKEDIEMVLIAAWFHDTGFKEIYTGHEEVSKEIAKTYLNSIKYPRQKINKVLRIINATKKSSKHNHLFWLG